VFDSYNRDINYLRVSVTDRCNLRCIYCMPKEGVSLIGHDDILRYEEILRIVRAAIKLGIRKVRVTGGEPLIRRGILDFLRELNMVEGLQDVSLTTNGIMLESMAEGIYRTGIRRINISLDSLNPEKYNYVTGGGSLEKVLNGIREAFRTGFSPIKINVVAIKGFNDDEILRFAGHTINRPYQVRFIELMPFGETKGDHDGKYLSNEFILEELNKEFSIEPIKGKSSRFDGPARLFRIKGAVGQIGLIGAGSQHLCDECNRLRLTAGGGIRACLFSDHEVDLKSAIRNGCSDDELTEMIRGAIREKPRGQKETAKGRSPRKCNREMSAIGG